MFQNAFQSGNHVEIFDSKSYLKDKDKNNKPQTLYKPTPAHMVKKSFEKDVKGYIFEIEGHSSKLRFPKDEKIDLALVQQFLVMQIYLPYSQPFSIEIVITDTSKTKRRINLVPGMNKIEKKFFHVKCPVDVIRHGEWMNLCIDVHSFMDAWKGQTFRSIDTIVIGSFCKLRKIFTTKYPIYQQYMEESQQNNEYIFQYKNQQDIPKSLQFPAGVEFTNQLISFQSIQHFLGILEVPQETVQLQQQFKQSNMQDMIQNDSQASYSNNFQASYQQQQQQMKQSNPMNLQRERSQQTRSTVQSQKFRQSDKSAPKTSQNPYNKQRQPQHQQQQFQQQQMQSQLMQTQITHSSEQQSTASKNFRNTKKSPLPNSQNSQVYQDNTSTNCDTSVSKNRLKISNIQSQNSDKKSKSNNNNNFQSMKSPYTTNNKNKQDNSSSNPWAPKSYQRNQEKKGSKKQSGHNLEDEELPQQQLQQLNVNGRQQSQKFKSVEKKSSNTNQNNLNQRLQRIQDQQKKDQEKWKKKEQEQVQKREIKTAQEIQKQKAKFKPKTVIKQQQQDRQKSKTQVQQQQQQQKGISKTPIIKSSSQQDNQIIQQHQQNQEGQPLLRTGEMRKTDNDYFELSQKFSTISDPRCFQLEANAHFRDSNLMQKNNQNHQNVEEIENEIEENIEMESKSMASPPKNQKKQPNTNNSNTIQEELHTYDTPTQSNRKQNNNSIQLKQMNNYNDEEESSMNAESLVVSNVNNPKQVEFSPSKDPNLADSLEVSKEQYQKIQKELHKTNNSKNNTIYNNTLSKQTSVKIEEMLSNNLHQQQEEDDFTMDTSEKKSTYYEDRINKFVDTNQRPFTPPFSQNLQQSSALITKVNKETVVIQQQQQNQQNNNINSNNSGSKVYSQHSNNLDTNNSNVNSVKSSQVTKNSQLNLYQNNMGLENENMLEVIYDPILNYYYDPKTNSYYELKA